jgi:hypothetical protein
MDQPMTSLGRQQSGSSGLNEMETPSLQGPVGRKESARGPRAPHGSNQTVSLILANRPRAHSISSGLIA